jgi:pimeloyl-ACP methyl ester carboxylesterase
MHRIERRLAWATAAVLTVCGFGAIDSVWPGDVGARARAVVAHVLATPAPSRAPGAAAPAALAVDGTDAPTATPTPVAPLPDAGTVDVLWSTVTNGSRILPVTVRFPHATGRYPLVVFAHGFAASADTYADLEEQIASAGFVVVAPEFPHSSSKAPQALDRDDVVNQASDVSAVITAFLDPNTVPAALGARIAAGPVGVVGHSDGGITAAAVAYNSSVADSRVGAAVVLSGAAVMYPGTWFTGESPPLLAVHGDADEVNPWWSSELMVDLTTGPGVLVTVRGGDHTTPYTTGAVEPAVGALAADFLRAYLVRDAAARTRIGADATADRLTLTTAR